MGLLDTGVKKISSLVGLTSLGRKAAAVALGIALSDEDKAALDLLATQVSADVVMQAAAAATGNGTALVVDRLSAIAFQVTGTFVGQVIFEGTVDNTNYVSITVTDISTDTKTTTTTTTGVYRARIAGFRTVRARVVSWTSGAITVTAHAIAGADAGQMAVSLFGKVTNPGDTALSFVTPSADGRAVGSYVPTVNFLHAFNGSSWDRVRLDAATGNLLAALPSTAYSSHSGVKAQIGAADVWTTTLVYNALPAGTSETTQAISVDGARAMAIWISNTTDQAMDIKLRMYAGVSESIAYHASLASGGKLYLTPAAGGTGADPAFTPVPALGFLAWASMNIGIIPAVAASSGVVRIDVGRCS